MPDPVTVTFLGGLGEIGRNCACIEVDGRILLLDCGLMFPNIEMLGIDLVLPDFTYLRDNVGRIDGCVATHGHEDHVGGLSFLLRELSFPVYGSALTLGLARHRIEEAGLLERTELIPVADGERRRIGAFDVEFIPVTHSVPHGFATAFHTPQGTILHSGDFKLDLTPVDGRLTDLGRIGAIASTTGIRVLLSDSTNADEPGHSDSERTVGQVLYDLFHAHEGRRIVIACFASHIHRIQQIADAAVAFGRTVATLGMSMRKNVRLARSMGLLQIPDPALRDIEEVGDLDPARVCVISTGSQGEPLSALSLMAASENRWLFTPVHGECRHMTSHARLAVQMGVAEEKVLVCEDGDQLVLSDAGVTRGEKVPAGYLYVDGIVGDVGQGVLRDRRVLAEEGVVVVIVAVDVTTGAIITGPEIITRGWVYAPEAETLLDECADEVRRSIREAYENDAVDIETLQRHVRKAAGRFVADRTRRRPMIVPVVMEA